MASVIITKIKRVNRRNRYENKIDVVIDGEPETRYYAWSPKLAGEAKKTHYQKVLEAESQSGNENKADYIKHSRKFASESTVQRKKSYKEREGVYYQSSIKIYLVVQHKNQTPFFFPQRGQSNFVVISASRSEKQMLKAVLKRASDYEAFNYWMRQFSKGNKDVRIYYGWTYKRFYSATGSFNGDTRYTDFKETRFEGRRMQKINYMRKIWRRKNDM